jgi:hypothetical protein
MTAEPLPVTAFPRLAIVDVETTGLQRTDPVIEIAVQVYEFDPPTGRLGPLVGQYVSLHDPGRPIPARITELTGITSAMVAGHAINKKELLALLKGVTLVVAHNASFDRPRVEAIVGRKRIKWLCSSRGVDWRGRGHPNAKLATLRDAYKIQTQAHRALGDVEAVAALLRQPTILAELLSERPIHVEAGVVVALKVDRPSPLRRLRWWLVAIVVLVLLGIMGRVDAPEFHQIAPRNSQESSPAPTSSSTAYSTSPLPHRRASSPRH